MCFRAQEHAAYEIRGRDAGRACDDFETAGALGVAVAVLAGGVGGDVVAVDDVVAAVVGYPGEGGYVGGVGDYFG